MKINPLSLLFGAAFSLLPFASAFPASANWTGATDGNWTIGTNWSATPVPGTPGGATSDVATFNNNVNTNVSLGGSQRGITLISFETTGVGSFTFSGTGSEGFTLNDSTNATTGTIRLTSTVTQAVTQTFNTPITLLGNARFENNSIPLSNLIINGDVVATGASASTLNLVTATSGNFGAVAVTGDITQGVGSGALGVLKSGSLSTGFLLGNNSYTGQTRFSGPSAGTLVFNSIGNVGGGASALGAPTTAADGTIAMPSSGTSPTAVLRYVGNGHSTNRTIQTGSSAGVTTTGSNATLEASGSGALVWNGNLDAVSFDGTDTLARTFNLGGTSDAANRFNGVIANSPTSTTVFAKRGSGTWVLSGNNSFTGGITITDGRLVLDYGTNATVINSANTIRLGQQNLSQSSGGILEFRANSVGTTTQNVGAITMINNGNNATNVSTGASQIILNRNGGDALTVTAASITRNVNNDLGSALLVDISSGGNLASTALISQSGGIAGWAVVRDSGGIGFLTQASAGANVARYTGATALTAGFGTTTTTTFSTSGNLTLTGTSRNFGALQVDTTGGGTLDLGGLTITSGNSQGRALLFTGNGNYTISNGTLSGSTGELILHQYSTGIVSLTGTTGTSTGQITKVGDGTLSMDNRGSTGALYISDGTLRANGANVLTAGRIILGGGAVLELTSASDNFTGAFGTAAGNLKITGSGGFSAFGTDRSVEIGGNTNSITWGASNFVGDGSSLILGSRDATATIDFRNGLAFGNSQRVVDVRNGTAAKDGVLSGVLTGAFGGGLIKRGTGTLEITGNSNTYMGDTWVSAGTLLVNNSSGSATGTGNVVVQSGGTLGGSGFITGGVTVASGGTLSPGNSPGLLTLGSLTLNSGSTTAFEINGTSRGVSFDAIDITSSGGIEFGGTFSLSFGSLLAENTVLDLFSFTGISTGDFSSMVSTGSYSGTWSKTGEVWSLSSGGQSLVFSEITGDLTVIPEPSSIALLAMTFAGALYLRRRRGSR